MRIAPGATAQPLPLQDVTKDLQKIKAALKELKTAAITALKAPQGPTNSRVAVPSYVNIAAKGATAPQSIQLPRTSKAPLRKGRKIIVRIRDQKEAQSVTNKSPAQILQKLAKQFPTQKAQIATARRLPSGNVVLHAISKKTRIQLKKQL